MAWLQLERVLPFVEIECLEFVSKLPDEFSTDRFPIELLVLQLAGLVSVA